MRSKYIFPLLLVLMTALCLHLPAIATADETIATTFKLNDSIATKVEIAGEFTDWKTVPLTKGESGIWTITLQLKPGYYGYKFIVNESPDWIFDPNNPVRKTLNGIENSGISVGGVKPPPEVAPAKTSVTFTHSTADAKTVHVAGEFNKWLNNVDGRIGPQDAWQLTNDGAGNWKLTTQLLPGKYKFKYVINSGDRWEKDKTLPGTDDGNSVIEVTSTGTSATPATPSGTQATFVYTADATTVSVAGEFNKWNATANPLKKNDTGVWTTTIPLKPGKYQYKLVINGTDWKADPGNNETATDSDGNINSVKVVAP